MVTAENTHIRVLKVWVKISLNLIEFASISMEQKYCYRFQLLNHPKANGPLHYNRPLVIVFAEMPLEHVHSEVGFKL